MKLRGATIFLLMQVFFVIFGFALYHGLKQLKFSLQEKRHAEIAMEAEANSQIQKTATERPR